MKEKTLKEKNSVLFVDDDMDLLDTFKEGLSIEGYHCQTASDASTALEMIEKNSYGIMVVDIMLPGMTGLELTAKAKKIKPNILIITMTGHIDKFTYDNVIDIGASVFIKKPFTLKELLRNIISIEIQKELYDREKELQEKVKELEEFYEMAVGRELRIKELKNENERLQAELEKYKKR